MQYICEEPLYILPTMSFPKFDLSPKTKGYLSKKESEKIIMLYRSLNFNVPKVVKYVYIRLELDSYEELSKNCVLIDRDYKFCGILVLNFYST
jgi:hypothetical protein